jgi:hypothetical protein
MGDFPCLTMIARPFAATLLGNRQVSLMGLVFSSIFTCLLLSPLTLCARSSWPSTRLTRLPLDHCASQPLFWFSFELVSLYHFTMVVEERILLPLEAGASSRRLAQPWHVTPHRSLQQMGFWPQS